MTHPDDKHTKRISTAVELVKYIFDPGRELTMGAYQFPEYARWACVEASRCACHALRAMLADLDLDIQVVEVKGMQPELLEKGCVAPLCEDHTPEDMVHCIVKVGDTYYDYSARQFSADADFPMVIKETDLHRYWKTAQEEELPEWLAAARVIVVEAPLAEAQIGLLYTLGKNPAEHAGAMNVLMTKYHLQKHTIDTFVTPLLKKAWLPIDKWTPLPANFKLWMPDGVTNLDPVSNAACRAELTRYNTTFTSGE